MTMRDGELFRILVGQHGEVDELLSELAAADDINTRAELYPKMKARLLAHAKAEEVTIYTSLAAAGEDEQSVHAIREHARIEVALATLDALDWDDEGFADALKELTLAVKEHVDEEESDMFDVLQDTMDDRELDDLAARFLTRYDDELATRTAGEAPTHPHPGPAADERIAGRGVTT